MPTLTRIGSAGAGPIRAARLIAAERTQHRISVMADIPPRRLVVADRRACLASQRQAPFRRDPALGVHGPREPVAFGPQSMRALTLVTTISAAMTVAKMAASTTAT